MIAIALSLSWHGLFSCACKERKIYPSSGYMTLDICMHSIFYQRSKLIDPFRGALFSHDHKEDVAKERKKLTLQVAVRRDYDKTFSSKAFSQSWKIFPKGISPYVARFYDNTLASFGRIISFCMIMQAYNSSTRSREIGGQKGGEPKHFSRLVAWRYEEACSSFVGYP